MPVVPQQFRSKSLPNRGILAGSGEEDPLGQQVSEHRQIVVSFAPVHLVGPHPNHVLEAQPLIRRLHGNRPAPVKPPFPLEIARNQFPLVPRCFEWVDLQNRISPKAIGSQQTGTDD
jgi:hypothetical protein